MKHIIDYITESDNSVLANVLNRLTLDHKYTDDKDSKELCNYYGLNKCAFQIEMPRLNKSNKYITLDIIEVKDKNKGTGKRFFTDLCKWADENDRILCLSPTDNFVGFGNLDRLVKLYKKFGFKQNNNTSPRAKNRQEMERKPHSIKECFATPLNTMGMGNPTLPTDTTPGSGDLLSISNKPKKNKFKSLKSYIKRKNKKVKD